MEIESAQKKGHVFYLRSLTKFHRARLLPTKEPTKALVDQEVFMIAGGDRALLVKVEIPSQEGVSDAYGYAQQWLTGLRVPMSSAVRAEEEDPSPEVE